MDYVSHKKNTAEILEENSLLREEVRTARRASDITAQLVVEQFVKVEKMLQRLEESESRYRELYQESNERKKLYESLLTSTPDAVVIFDSKQEAIYINPAFTRIFGFTPDDVLGRSIPFIPENEESKTAQVIQQVLQGKPASDLETTRLTKNGRLLDISLSASSYVECEGQPPGIMMILRNVTQRKLAESLLQRERETFFSILQKAPFGVVLLDSDDRCLYINPEYVKITGYTLEDTPTLQEWLRRAYPDPQYRRKVVERWEKKSCPTNTKRVFKAVCRDGRVKEIEFRRTALDDSRVIVMMSDVTERQQAEEKIRRAKEQWERTFDAIEDVVTVQDAEMRIVRANRAAGRILNSEPGALIGKACFEVFADRSSPCRGCPIIHTFQDHLPHSGEVEHPHLGRISLITTSPIFDDDGKFAGIVHWSKDITEKRKIEEELLKAQKLESIGILAGGIAHDFNNILTAILGNISLAKVFAGNPEKAKERLEEAGKACLRAKDLTHQLLTFSKGGAPVKKAMSLVELIKDSAAFALRGSNVRCEYAIAEPLWTVEIDEGQISQVINNLIINACQAMPQGGAVEIHAENIMVTGFHDLPLPTGKYVKITVRDHGTGIPQEYIPKIFDPYFTTKPFGNGLGLTTAYSIIKKHDGYMTAQSRHGEGTTFVIYLPAIEKRPLERRKAVDEKCIAGKGKILVMDDEKIIRDLTGQMLRFLKYEVEFATDGDEAVELYKRAIESGTPFDVVLMDLTIPGGMGGKDAIERLRELDPEIKAIVSSGYYTDPIISNYREYGFSGVLAKPFKIKEMSEILHNVIEAVSSEQ